MDSFGKILLVDDNPDVLFSLQFLLEPYCKAIATALSPAEALQTGTVFGPDVWLADMNFRTAAQSGAEGFRLLSEILEWDANAVVILMTAYGDTAKAVQAIKAGATDFISKPWEKDRLLATLGAAFQARALKKEAQQLKNQVQTLSQKVQVLSRSEDIEKDIIGESPAMQEVLDLVERLKDTDANVLLTGENGTGKDLLAQTLHRHSERAAMPMISIDLGAIPETLFESELFGYEKGAFTDARAAKPGRIEVAAGGTLFLNEIGNLTLSMQAKLLQVLESRTVQRLGGVHPVDVDVRLLCATNRDLAAAVAEGAFREDLLYRINTVELHLPALRERGNDVLLLANHFLTLYATKYRKSVPRLTKGACTRLLQYAWPGNVRELQHVMERAVLFAKDTTIQAEELWLRPTVSSKKNEPQTMNLEQLERQTVVRALEMAHGNVSQAADMLGITRYALYRKMEKFAL